MTKIDLSKSEDGLDGFWWNRIRISDFAFIEHIPNMKEAELEEGDILVHKKIMEGERFPTIRYSIAMDGNLYQLRRDDINKHMVDKLIKYITEHKALPNCCTYIKSFKNESVQIDYKPTKFDNFALKITPEQLPTEDPLETFIKELKHDSVDTPEDGDDCQHTINPIKLGDLMYMINRGEKKVYIEKAKIIDINKRREFYQGHHTSFYLIHLKDGVFRSSEKPTNYDETITGITVRCSKTLMCNEDKTLKYAIGDIVSLNGLINDDKKLGTILQNIRKIEKH